MSRYGKSQPIPISNLCWGKGRVAKIYNEIKPIWRIGISATSTLANDFKKEFIPLSELAIGTPYSAEYLSLLARKGKLSARKIDNVWHATREAVSAYVAEQADKARAKETQTEWKPLSELAPATPYSAEYLSLLARRHKLSARKIDNVWYATKADIAAYQAKVSPVTVAAPLALPAPEKKLFLHDVRRKTDEITLKLAEVKGRTVRTFTAYAELLATLPAPTVRRWTPGKALASGALALVFALSAGAYSLSYTAPHLASQANRQAAQALAALLPAEISATQTASLASLFSSLRDVVIARFFGSPEESGGETPSNLFASKVDIGTTTLADAASQALTEAAAYNPAKYGSTSLTSEIRSFIQTEIAKLAAPNIVYNTQTYSPVILREEILVADTRPTVTRQSTSDIDHGASALNALANGGSLFNNTLTNPNIIGGTGSFSSISFTNSSIENSTTTNLFAFNLLFDNATGTNATTTTSFATTASSTNLFATNANLGFLSLGQATATSATTTNLFATTASSTNFFSTNLYTGNATSTGLFSVANIWATGSSTLENFTFANATGTNATTTNFFATTASSTNLFSASASFGNLSVGLFNSGSTTLSNLLVSGSSTLQNFTFVRATGTAATTTNFFSTKGTFDELYVNNYQQNDGTFLINSTVATGDIFAVNDSAVTSGKLIHQTLTANAGNGQKSYGQVIDLTDSTVAGGGYSGLEINVSGSGTGSGSKTLLTLNPSANNTVVFDNAGSLRPTTNIASNTNSLGSPSFYWKNAYIDTVTANSLSGTVVTGATSNNTWTVGSTETGDAYKALIFQRNSGSGNALFQWDAGANDLRYLSVNYPLNATYTVDDASISTAANLFSGALTNNTTSGTQRLLSLTNTGTGTTENGIYINNTGTGNTAFEIAGTWTNGLLISSGSSTLQNFTFVRATGTAATTTNSFATTASSTNLFSSVAAIGGAQGLNVVSSGNVGIGTTNPGSYALNIQSAQATVNVQSTTATNYSHIQFANGSGNTILGTERSVTGGLFGSGTLPYASVFGSSASTAVQLATNNTVRLTIDTIGSVGIGTTTPGEKLDVHDGSFVLTDSDVAHGMTSIASSSAFALFKIQDPLTGGLQIKGMSDDGATESLLLDGIMGSTDPTDTQAAVAIRGMKKSGTTAQALGSSETVLNVKNLSSVLMTVLGSGNVGIGTTTPDAALTVLSTGFPVSRFIRSTSVTTGLRTALMLTNRTSADMADGFGSGLELAIQDSAGVENSLGAIYGVRNGADNTGDLQFQTASAGSATTKLTITGGGNVGIGTTTPQRNLSIYTGSSPTLQLYSGSTGEGNSDGYQLAVDGSNNAYLWNFENTSLLFGTNNTERARFTAGGNFGIGTTSPAARTDIYNATAGVNTLNVTHASASEPLSAVALIQNTQASNFPLLKLVSAAGGTANFGGNLYIENSSNNLSMRIDDVAGDTTPFVVDQSGNVGIGMTNPGAKLQVAGAVNLNDGTDRGLLTFSSTGWNRFIVRGQSGYALSFGSNATDGLMVLDTAGNVGIGTTNPGSLLHVKGIGGASQGLTVGNANKAVQLFASDNSSSPTFRLSADSGAKLSFAANGGTDQVMIDTTGNVGVGTTTPGYKVTAATAAGSYGFVHSDGTREIGTYVDATYGGWLGTRSNHNLNFFTNNSNPLVTLTTAGLLGIGTTTPANKLDVFGNVMLGTGSASAVLKFVDGNSWANFRSITDTGSALTFSNTESGGSFTFSMEAAGTDHFDITSGGNSLFRVRDDTGFVGIGTTTPANKLEVVGTIGVRGASGGYRMYNQVW